ncbi:MAG: lysophospholipid acyltransferase family protein [Paracoccaceae bacterium]|jgi:putative hemolysin|nr:lysophospholipid acyltransferase family protein [Pseudomonadota bacterium]MDA0849906.1 lysophospholipid acyltransferase family protein [Pseudomonadota bacterium]MDA1294840.1 lysophospholipid acyltransferase family protein [Pseudomonadota bacterium]
MERTQEQTRPSDAPVDAPLPLDVQPYDRRKLSYANTFENPLQRITIQTIELLTARLRILRRIRKFEAQGVPFGQPFWKQALDTMGIKLLTPEEQIARIPKDGPIVVTSNHPHGLVDGMILGELIGQVRTDYKILTRSLLTGVAEIDQFMIPVPFPHEPDALEKNLWMRKQAMDHLKNGGIVAVFPSGSVAASRTMFGPVIEHEWNPFTSKMIQRSNAEVLPIFFPGANSRLYQIANQISATLRQGLLLYEITHAFNRPQSPVVGHVISRDKISKWSDNPRGFMSWLREETLRLRTHPNG